MYVSQCHQKLTSYTDNRSLSSFFDSIRIYAAAQIQTIIKTERASFGSTESCMDIRGNFENSGTRVVSGSKKITRLIGYLGGNRVPAAALMLRCPCRAIRALYTELFALCWISLSKDLFYLKQIEVKSLWLNEVLYSTLCRWFVRLQREFFKCLYGSLKDKCNATASSIFTKYNLISEKRILPGCDISKQIFCVDLSGWSF